jgi:hypothetical protein
MKKEQLVVEKVQMETTLMALSEEVDALSKKNEELLRDLRTRDFYSGYESL